MGAVAPLVTLFAQMAASEQDAFVDSSAVERCRVMMQKIVDKVKENLIRLEDAEAEALETFNGVKANLDATIKDLADLSVKLQLHIDDMNSCVLEEDIIRTAAAEKKNRNKDMLDTAKSMCDAFKHEFEVATEGRNEERDLLRIIKQMAEKRMVKYRDA